MAWMLAGLMGHIGNITVRGGMITGAFVWTGFVITTMGVNHAFGGQRPMLTLIDGGLLACRAGSHGGGDRRLRRLVDERAFAQGGLLDLNIEAQKEWRKNNQRRIA